MNRRSEPAAIRAALTPPPAPDETDDESESA